MKKIKISALLLLSLVFAVGCCPCRRGGSAPQLLELDSSWRTVQMGSRSFEGEGYTLSFGAEGKLMGRGDCNRIMGSYSADESRALSLSELSSTRAMCEDAQGERAFLDALDKVDSYSIDGGMLLLLSEGSVLLIMESSEQ